MRTLFYACIGLCLVVGLAASCGSSGENGSGDLAEELDAREFWSTSITMGNEPYPLVGGTRITLRFNGDQIAASAGCNSIGGMFQLDGATLSTSDLFMTEMGCDPDRHAQDDFVASTLLAMPTITLDGNNLTIETPDVVMELLDVSIANPDRDIIGTRWTVTGFIDGQAATSFAIDEPARVDFGRDSTMRGFDGCAEFSLPVEISDGSVGGPVEGDGEMQFGVADRTPLVDCANPAYVEAFHRLFATGDATFTINGTNLTIMNSDGFGTTLTTE